MRNVIVALGLASLVAACGAPQQSSRQPGQTGQSASGQSASGQSASGQSARAITIKGSDTMVHLVSAWAEEYGKQHPGTDITVTGGGSGTGISALIAGGTDICAASREITAQESALAKQKGKSPAQTVVARDGIAVIVHPSNPLNELTIEQIGKLYTGATVDWKDIGGTPGSILLVSRESSSGTYAFFQEHVLKKQDYSPRARLMPATSSIIQSVSEDKAAIGYVGLGYALEAKEQVKILGVKATADAPTVIPSEKSVRDGSYSVARPLYFYATDGASEAIKSFVQYCLSDAGQKIVNEKGFVTVK